MNIISDITLDVTKFDPSLVPQEQHDFNKKIAELTSSGPRWYQVGAAEYRKMRAMGKTPLPAAKVLEAGINITIPSRDPSRDIPCRLFLPSNGAVPTATFMHIHGGGWVLQSERDFDPYLQNIADGSDSGIPLAAISIGYRLAPENPFPAAQHDCYDAGEWLANNAPSDDRLKRAPLAYIGGESAGGHLTILTALHLLSLPEPYTRLKGLTAHFGVFSLLPLPAHKNFEAELLLTPDIMSEYAKAVTPQSAKGDQRYLMTPEVSPIYAKMEHLRGRLPPALFTCGTADPLLDDTVFMGTKWMITGQKNTFIKIYPGQPHGFIFFPRSVNPGAAEAFDDIGKFFSIANSLNA